MEKKEKVLFVATANNIHTVKWVNALSDYFEIHLAYCKGHEESVNKIDERVILHELKYRPPLGYYLNAHQLKKVFKEVNPSLVNVHYASGYGTLARVAKIKPVLLSIWGSDVYDFPNESGIKKRILEKNVRCATAIGSTSNVMAEELRRQVKGIKQEIHITPFGVNVEKFKNNNKLKEDNYFTIGNIKALEEKYGVKYGILAVKQLIDNLIQKGKKAEAESIRMNIYGDGSQKEELSKLIGDNNLTDVVFLKGKIPNEEVPNALNELDVFCATSILDSESFGVAVVEAMSCEVPVVVTDVDGFREVVEDNKTGYIVERKNVEKIAEALEKVMNASEARKNMGKAGRERVLANYEWKANVETMCKIYNQIINK